MRTWFVIWTGLIGLFGLLYPISSSIAAEDNAAALFGALPTFGPASLSASGKYLAFVTPIDGAYNLIISEVDTPGKVRRIAFGPSTITSINWHNDSHLLVRLNTVAKECVNAGIGSQRMRCSSDDTIYRQTYIVPVASGGDPIPINRNGHFGSSGFSDQIVDLTADKTHIYMSGLEYEISTYLTRNLWKYNLISVNLANGGSVIVREGLEQTGNWFTDGGGQILARIDVLGPNHRDVLVPFGKDFHSAASLNSPDAPEIAGLAEDGRSLAVLARLQGGARGLYPLDLKSGAVGGALYLNPSYDVVRVVKDDHSQRVIGVEYYDGNFRAAYFSPERQKLQKQIEEILPGRAAHLLSTTDDGKKTLVFTTTPQGSPALHLVNLSASRIDNIAESYPQLRGTPLADVRRYDYRTSDGLVLSGVLALPPGKDPRNLPLVVLPEGGFGYGLADFDWFAQFIAHRGYAVFQADKRSTKGFGEITDIDELQAWTDDVQQGLGSGVDDLIAKGIADPKRVCVAGGGLNGYIALSAMVFGNDRYGCAIAFTPLTNLTSLIIGSRASSPFANLNSTFVRNHDKFSTILLDKFSPSKHAAQFRGPVLLVDVDKPGWNSQSLNMRETLQGENKPVEMVLFKDEDGKLSRAENRIAFLDAVDRFLAARMGN